MQHMISVPPLGPSGRGSTYRYYRPTPVETVPTAARLVWYHSKACTQTRLPTKVFVSYFPFPVQIKHHQERSGYEVRYELHRCSSGGTGLPSFTSIRTFPGSTESSRRGIRRYELAFRDDESCLKLMMLPGNQSGVYSCMGYFPFRSLSILRFVLTGN